MSNVSTAHDLVPFVSGKTAALSGQRLSKVIAKPGKRSEGSQGLEKSLCVSIPMLTLDAVQNAIPHLTVQIQGMLEDAQDKIVRERAEEGASVVLDSEIGMDAVLQYLAAVQKGNRLTKEIVQQWFCDSYLESFMQFFCAVNKWDVESLSTDQAGVLEQKGNAVRDLYASLSSGKTRLSRAQCLSLRKFAGSIPEESRDVRFNAFHSRIDKMLEEDSADALGF